MNANPTHICEKVIRWCALLTSGIIVSQMAFILFKGETFCLNEGCEIVEKLTSIPPFFINLTGLVYFLSLFFVFRRRSFRSLPAFDWPRFLLLTGLTVEGVLIGYQFFVVQTLCFYCLFIFSIIFLLNMLYGLQQAVTGVLLFLTVFASFAVLNFGPALLVLQKKSLGTGSFAIRRCAEPSKQLYFFFSSNCPHCRNVLNALQNCNSCEFYFNPVDRIQSLALPDLEFTLSYEPALNRLILSLLGINTIPVLLVQNPDGLTFIKGETSITRYISQACFRENPLLYLDSSQYNEPDGISVYNEQEGDCTIQLDCPDIEIQPNMSTGK